MSQMQIDQVLAQIRALSTQTHAQPGAPSAAGGAGNFATLLKSGIDEVNKTAQHAAELATAFQRGAPGVELPQVMVELQKASVSFRGLAEARNRLISAYQEIMSMQV